ncbi:MAG TPA: hypothetical protein VLC93_18305, partial [Myxococcota bacterium]|nr:hypothetical protein [Myxococcota bacterium]
RLLGTGDGDVHLPALVDRQALHATADETQAELDHPLAPRLAAHTDDRASGTPPPSQALGQLVHEHRQRQYGAPMV